jgi:quercetin dioxygenase-like cupin family protein
MPQLRSPNAGARGDNMKGTKDASRLFEVEKLTYHAARPRFRIAEITINPTQGVPWHYHSKVQDTFYVVEGQIRLSLRDPQEEVRLAPGETYSVWAQRPHLVTNEGRTAATFLVLQFGEYDFVPLTY